MLQTFITGTNTSSQTFAPFTGASVINDCLLQPMLHVNHPLLQFADITDSLLSMLHCFPDFIAIWFRLELLRWPYILLDKFWGLTCNMFIEIGSNCNRHVSQGSVETYKGEVENFSDIYVQNFLKNRSVSGLQLMKGRWASACVPVGGVR